MSKLKLCPLKMSNPELTKKGHPRFLSCEFENCVWFEGGPIGTCSIRVISISLRNPIQIRKEY